MDLSLKHATTAESTETFDYRHKKFDHVRSSPLTWAQCESERNLVSPTNFYQTTQAKIKSELEARDHDWEQEMDSMNMLSTPSKRQRVSKRKTHNFCADLCVPNAPKKRKVQATTQTTPTKAPAPNAYPAQATPVLMPKISNEALARICQYNKNMVRKFPKKERSVKDQERRDKNTIACRMSRRLKKLENLAIEEQYKIFVQEHLEQQKRVMHAAVYLNELIKSGAPIPSDDQINDEFVKTISQNLSLKYLQKCLSAHEQTTAVLSDEGSQIKMEEVIDVESVELAAQHKRPFTIAFLLGGAQQQT